MKKFGIFVMALILTGNMAFAANVQPIGTYGIHLFFDEKEFIDVLVIEKKADGSIGGRMEVPNDFENKIENVVIQNKTLTFDLLVPKNSSRLEDLIFHYEGTFFNETFGELAGFVTIKGQREFVASFVGFIRK